MEVLLLGGFAVSIAGRPVADNAWRLRRARTLIKLLALAPERAMHRELLAELMWPDEPPVGNSFHQVLYTARRADAVAWAQATHAALAPALTGGSYVNFLSDEGESRVRAAYRSRTYRRLVALKDEYDPANVFRLNQNVAPSR